MVISAFQDGKCLLLRVCSNAHLGTRQVALLSYFVANFCNRFTRNTMRQTVCLLNARLWNFRRTFSILSNLSFSFLLMSRDQAKLRTLTNKNMGWTTYSFLFLASLSSYAIVTNRSFYLVILTLIQLMLLVGMVVTLFGRMWRILNFTGIVNACTKLSIGMGKICSGSARRASFVF